MAVTFSEAMDQTVAPVLTFDPAVASTLSLTGGSWNAAGTVYTATYGMTDAGVVANGVTVDVSGAQDAAGNAQDDYTGEAEFSIDTTNPTATVVIDEAALNGYGQQLAGDDQLERGGSGLRQQRRDAGRRHAVGAGERGWRGDLDGDVHGRRRL